MSDVSLMLEGSLHRENIL